MSLAKPEVCAFCGKTARCWPHGTGQRRYCSAYCRDAYRKLLAPQKRYIGAMSELKVSIHLMERGFEVFRALDAQASCDLLVLKNGKHFRVEVRTGHRRGRKIVIRKKGHRADYMAISLDDDEVVFDPPLPL